MRRRFCTLTLKLAAAFGLIAILFSQNPNPPSPSLAQTSPRTWDAAIPNPYRQSLGGTPDYISALTDCMSGTVLVRCIFVDSNGVIDPDLHSWTQQEIDSVFQKIACEYNFTWSRWIQQYSESVQFSVEKFTVPIRFEPVLHASSSDQVWIGDALTYFGYAYTTDRTQTFINCDNLAAYIRTNNTFGQSFDHAFLMFLAANSGQSFPDGYYAYAYIGGPHTVLLRSGSGFVIQNVAVHETGHIFWAQDEYAGSCTCGAQGNESYRVYCRNDPLVNNNCQANGCQSVACIMRWNEGGICAYTPRHIGWFANPGPPLGGPQITNIKCPGCTSGGKLIVKGSGLDSSCSVFIDCVEHTATYRPDTLDLAVKNLYLTPGVYYSFRVKRYSDGTLSEAYVVAFSG